VFVTWPAFCGELCASMLRLCGYNNYVVKEEATSMLYFLIRVTGWVLWGIDLCRIINSWDRLEGFRFS
jgi:hypothetical protein